MSPIPLVQISLAFEVATYLLSWPFMILGGAYWRRDVNDALEDLGDVEELDTFYVSWSGNPRLESARGSQEASRTVPAVSPAAAIEMFISLTVDGPLVFFMGSVALSSSYRYYVLSLPPKVGST